MDGPAEAPEGLEGLEPPRWPGLPDLHNLRDVGGLRTPQGRLVRREVLYRCGTPAFLDDAQARVLVEDVGVRTRVDLRGDAEVAEETSAALLAREHRALHLPVRVAPADGTFAEARGVEAVGRYYAAYLRASGDSLAAFARLLLDDAAPLLVHCTAGKDRTGTAVAVVLDAVGVRRDDIVADYARTTAAMPGLRAQIAVLPTYAERLHLLPAEAFDAAPPAMETFLSLLDAEHGGGRGYLAGQGLAEPELDRLVDVLLEP